MGVRRVIWSIGLADQFICMVSWTDLSDGLLGQLGCMVSLSVWIVELIG